MTQPQPVQGTPPPNPAPPPHTPLVDRVQRLEDNLSEFIKRHNAFTDDVVKELGL